MERLTLCLGPWSFTLEGLDPELCSGLSRRWGRFAGDRRREVAHLVEVVALEKDPGDLLLPRWQPGEVYRCELAAEEPPLLRSYHFALAGEADDPHSWRLTLLAGSEEPRERAVENAVRYLVALAALDAGGLALHGAGVLREERGWVFVGGSGAGKTTVVRLSGPGASLGDDFAVLLPAGSGWRLLAVPFDNAEEPPPPPAIDEAQVAGIWRLFQADEDRLERLDGTTAVLSLTTCAAFGLQLGSRSQALLDVAATIIRELPFGHLFFKPTEAFWRLLLSEVPD